MTLTNSIYLLAVWIYGPHRPVRAYDCATREASFYVWTIFEAKRYTKDQRTCQKNDKQDTDYERHLPRVSFRICQVDSRANTDFQGKLVEESQIEVCTEKLASLFFEPKLHHSHHHDQEPNDRD